MDGKSWGLAVKPAYWLCAILLGLGSGILVDRLTRKPPAATPTDSGRHPYLPRPDPARTAEPRPPSEHAGPNTDSLSLLLPEPTVPDERGRPPAAAPSAPGAVAFEESHDDAPDDAPLAPSSRASPRARAGLQSGQEAAAIPAASGQSAVSGEVVATRVVARSEFAAGVGAAPGKSTVRSFDSRQSRRSAPGQSPASMQPFEALMAALPPGAAVGDAVLRPSAVAPGLPPEPTEPPPQYAAPERPDEDEKSGGFTPAIDPAFGPEEPGPTPPKLYRIGSKGAERWTDARALGATLEDFKTRLALNGSYRVQVEGETAWSAWMNRDTALAHIQWRLKTRYIGDVVAVGTADPLGKPGSTWLARVVRKDPKPAKPSEPPPVKPANTAGNADIDRLHAAVWAAFPDLESWGMCNRRRISGSSTWSQHAWCNAEDLHRDLNGKSYKASMDPVARWLEANRARYDIQYIIWRRDPKCDDMTNDHCNHIHVDMKPSGNGTPPCAR